MDLKTYFFGLPPEDRDGFAKRCGTKEGHMRNVAYGYRKASTELAVSIERETRGEVSRKDMFPESFAAKWPELALRRTAKA